MSAPPPKKPKLLSPEAPGGDFFYDELMTAQPDATGEFYRRWLMLAAPVKKPEPANEK